MNQLADLLGIDLNSPEMQRASQFAENDRALLRALVRIRKEAKLSQEEVGVRMGVRQSTIARFEAHDSNPTLATIRRYAHAVGALVAHDVQRDEGQLMDPRQRDRWVTGATPTATIHPLRGEPATISPAPDAVLQGPQTTLVA